MSNRMRKILESKRAMRKQLAELSFSAKVAILEKLRDRSLLIAASSLRRPRSKSA
jgi:predicted type IV restriction endonuclease